MSIEFYNVGNQTNAELVEGTVLYWTIRSTYGNVTESDFEEPIQGTVTIENGEANFDLTAAVDSFLEGIERFVIELRVDSFDGEVIAESPEITIDDLGLVTQQYYIYALTPRVSEGDSVRFYVNTVNVPDGTTLFWTIEGAGDNPTEPSDFLSSVTSGQVTIQSNSAEFTVATALDSLDEGDEEFVVNLRGGSIGGTVLATSTRVTIEDAGPAPLLYSITPDKTSIVEGETVTFDISTTGVANNTTLHWSVIGIVGEITSNDFDGGVRTGQVTVVANRASLELTASEDGEFEPDEVFAVTLHDAPPTVENIVATSSRVVITAPDTGYTITADKLTLTEDADVVNFLVTTDGIPDGTDVNWTLRSTRGLVDSSDFGGTPISGTLTISSGSAAFSLVTNPDETTEGVERFLIELRDPSTSDILAESQEVTILDTSKGEVDYVLTAAPQVAPEGTTINFTITTTPAVPDGTVLYWDIDPAFGIVDVNDFSGPISGSVTTTGGIGQFSLETVDDGVLEGDEIFYTYIRTGSAAGPIVASEEITITDIGDIELYSLTADNVLVSEGDTVTFTVQDVTGLGEGVNVYWYLAPSRGNLNDDDFEGATSGNVTISGGTASFSVTVSDDDLPEGDEAFVAVIKRANSDGEILASSQVVTIQEVFLFDPIFTVIPRSVFVQEGDTVIFDVNTSFVPSETPFYWKVAGASGDITADDFDTDLTGAGWIIDGAAEVEIEIAEDGIVEGPESFVLEIYTGEIYEDNKVATSIPVNIGFVGEGYSVITETPVIFEGNTASFRIETNDIAEGSILYWSLEAVSGDLNSNDFSVPITGSFPTPASGEFTVELPTVVDAIDEGEEEFILNLYDEVPGVGVTPVASATIPVKLLDGFSDPLYTVFPDKPIVNEGDSVTFSITALNVEDGTSIYWSIAAVTPGLSLSDFDESSLVGEVIINNGGATVTLTTSDDGVTDPDEVFYMQLRTDSVTGPIVQDSPNVTISEGIVFPPLPPLPPIPVPPIPTPTPPDIDDPLGDEPGGPGGGDGGDPGGNTGGGGGGGSVIVPGQITPIELLYDLKKIPASPGESVTLSIPLNVYNDRKVILAGIEWGYPDGSTVLTNFETVTNEERSIIEDGIVATHTYPASAFEELTTALVVVKIYGSQIPRIGADGPLTKYPLGINPGTGEYETATYGTSHQGLISVDEWGTTSFSTVSLRKAFEGANNLSTVTTNGFPPVVDLSFAFKGASRFDDTGVASIPTGAVTTMESLFEDCGRFNVNIGAWDTSAVTNMRAMFKNAIRFDQNIGSWNTSNVNIMTSMFEGAVAFDQDIGSWDVEAVRNFNNMFAGAILFNKDIGTWGVGFTLEDNDTLSMTGMFNGATEFNQNLTCWNVESISSEPDDFSTDSALVNTNKPLWGLPYDPPSQQDVRTGSSCFSELTPELENDMELVYDLSKNSGSNDVSRRTITMLLQPSDTTPVNVQIDWGDGGAIQTVQYDAGTTPSPVSHTYAPVFQDATEVIVKLKVYNDLGNIVGQVPRFTASGSNALVEVRSFGSIQMESFEGAFSNCANLVEVPARIPSGVTSFRNTFSGASSFNSGNVASWNVASAATLASMFRNATSFDQNISAWSIGNVTTTQDMFSGASSYNNGGSSLSWGSAFSNVTNMSGMFRGATSFDQNVGSFDTSSVTNMSSVFSAAAIFNNGGSGDINNWDTSSATTMRSMFATAVAFNQDVGAWDVSSVLDMASMFKGATDFNQNLSCWDVSDRDIEGTPTPVDNTDFAADAVEILGPNFTAGYLPLWGLAYDPENQPQRTGDSCNASIEPVYNLNIVGSDTINEGSAASFTVSTQFVLDDTVLTWKVRELSGTIDSADIEQTEGTVEIYENVSDQVNIFIKNDLSIDEGVETFTVDLYDDQDNLIYDGAADNKIFTINDTSTTFFRFTYSEEDETQGFIETEEGASYTFNIVSNSPVGAQLYWKIVSDSGFSVDDIESINIQTYVEGSIDNSEADLNVDMEGMVILGSTIPETSSRARITVFFKEDFETEGLESFEMELYYDT